MVEVTRENRKYLRLIEKDIASQNFLKSSHDAVQMPQQEVTKPPLNYIENDYSNIMNTKDKFH
jgi:hypothetical protein